MSKPEYKFVIQSILTNGFWSKERDDFKGFLFATYFDFEDDEEIMKAIKDAVQKSACTVIKIYIKS